MITNYHLLDKTNAGDMLSSPLHYFEFSCEVRKANLRTAASVPVEGDVILGGGGLLANAYLEEGLNHLYASAKGKLISWGVGHNIHTYPINYFSAYNPRNKWRKDLRAVLIPLGLSRPPRETKISYTELREFMSRFDLHGIRDYGFDYEWVPCVSCMHPAFDEYRKRTSTHDVVVFDHPLFMKLEIFDFPKFSNLHATFQEVLEFLSSGETIVTSSYHGAYWGILLGRKVICVPWSTKFMAFKHPIVHCPDLVGLGKALKKAMAFSSALEECREANLLHASRVASLLDVDVRPRRAIPL